LDDDMTKVPSGNLQNTLLWKINIKVVGISLGHFPKLCQITRGYWELFFCAKTPKLGILTGFTEK